MAIRVDKQTLIGTRFGHITIVGDAGAKKMYNAAGKQVASIPLWACKCDCGKEYLLSNQRLMAKQDNAEASCKSCASAKSAARMGKGNLGGTPGVIRHGVSVGCRIGSATVVGYEYSESIGQLAWKCECDCGSFVFIVNSKAARKLADGARFACQLCSAQRAAKNMGIANKSHGLSYTKEYGALKRAIERCHNPGNKSYARYGGRGIVVCQEWRDAGGETRFAACIGPPPNKKSELDRIDPNGNYEPGNCRWVDEITQARNKRSARMLTARGKTAALCEWAEEVGVSPYVIAQRLLRGASEESAIFAPLQKNTQGIRLTPEQRATMLARYEAGDTSLEIAKDLGIGAAPFRREFLLARHERGKIT